MSNAANKLTGRGSPVARGKRQPRVRRKCRRLMSLTIAAFTLCSAVPCVAQLLSDPRGLAVAEVNEMPAFLVRVDVDHPDRVYRGGDAIQVSVRSEREGYLYLFYCDTLKRVTCLFPNIAQNDNHIPANHTVVIPDALSRFQLRVGPPFGNEVLKAVITTEPLQSLEVETLTKSNFTLLQPQKLKAVFVEVNGGDPNADMTLQDTRTLKERNRDPTRQWAEHHVPVTTVGAKEELVETPKLDDLPRLADVVARTQTPGTESPNEQPVPRPDDVRPKRVGVFIGVSNYQDPEIRPLKVADRDAATLAAAMKQYGGLDEMAVLVNEQATLRNIGDVIRGSLPAATRPGDLVFIYWSGHGGRTSNLDGTEPDGYDEYLVPYDGRLEPAEAIRQTMLMDKAFGRWVQQLDGRKLVMIIDACHSGGQTQRAIKSLTGSDPEAPFRKFFFATMWKRTKDIGQRETAVLASSRATQVSLERREGDLSVMTYFLIKKLEEAATPVTLLDAVEYVQTEVPAFVEKHYAGTTQTPVFVDQTTPPVYLRP